MARLVGLAALVIASIAVGIFAVGTVQLLRSVILSELQIIYAASNASSGLQSACTSLPI